MELRAAISLSRCWLAQGKQAAARQTLDEARQWFGEGAGTHDLKKADELRAELALRAAGVPASPASRR